jgi:hypothetical protein
MSTCRTKQSTVRLKPWSYGFINRSCNCSLRSTSRHKVYLVSTLNAAAREYLQSRRELVDRKSMFISWHDMRIFSDTSRPVEAHPTCCSVQTAGSFLRVKRPQRTADQQLPPSTEINNEWKIPHSCIRLWRAKNKFNNHTDAGSKVYFSNKNHRFQWIYFI